MSPRSDDVPIDDIRDASHFPGNGRLSRQVSCGVSVALGLGFVTYLTSSNLELSVFVGVVAGIAGFCQVRFGPWYQR
jgi:uncharacterized membrane protein HdeD (DUF308 family)